MHHADLHSAAAVPGVGQRLRTFAAIQRGRDRHIGRGGETTLHARRSARHCPLPAVAVAIIEHGAEHQAVFQQRVGIHRHFGGGRSTTGLPSSAVATAWFTVVAGTHAAPATGR
jgi:hypothetical protein